VNSIVQASTERSIGFAMSPDQMKVSEAL